MAFKCSISIALILCSTPFSTAVSEGERKIRP